MLWKRNKSARRRLLSGLMVFAAAIYMSSLSFSQDIRYQSGDRRDPFVPVEPVVPATVAAVTGLQIEGILFDPKGNSMVVIQGELYKVGDQIGSQKIVSIQSNKVVVQVNNVETAYWVSAAEQELDQKSKK